MKIGFATKLLDQEVAIFKLAGWRVVEPVNAQLLDDYEGLINIIAVSLGIAEADAKLTGTAERLCVLINEAGIQCKLGPVRQGSIGGTLEPGSIYLLIGAHRLPAAPPVGGEPARTQ